MRYLNAQENYSSVDTSNYENSHTNQTQYDVQNEGNQVNLQQNIVTASHHGCLPHTKIYPQKLHDQL